MNNPLPNPPRAARKSTDAAGLPGTLNDTYSLRGLEEYLSGNLKSAQELRARTENILNQLRGESPKDVGQPLDGCRPGTLGHLLDTSDYVENNHKAAFSNLTEIERLLGIL